MLVSIGTSLIIHNNNVTDRKSTEYNTLLVSKMEFLLKVPSLIGELVDPYSHYF